MDKSAAIHEALVRLRRRYPDGGALEIGTPFHLLVLVLLSARTRDEQVLKLAPGLFAEFPTPAAMAAAPVTAIERCIDSIGLFRAKAKNLKALAQKLMTDYDGEVPSTMEALLLLPGVGRKTASVVLVAAFGQPAIAVDVHVFRIVQRLGWVKGKTPEEVEQKLRVVVPQEHWSTINQTMVPFGRAICVPGKPRCWSCPLQDVCAFSKKQLTPPANAAALQAAIVAKEAALEQLKQTAATAIAYDET